MTIGVRDVRWAAGGRMIVDGVTLDVPAGGMLGLLGPNGSGKSSLLRVIAGLRRPASGVVTLDGADLATFGRRALARRLALVEQAVSTDSPVTVLDAVRLGRTPHQGVLPGWTAADEQAVEAALRWTGLAGRGGQRWHTLSGGERQRVQIARALAQCPRELLLDEPTNHLDVRHQLDLLALVRSLPATSIVALHDLNHAAMFCDTLALLRDGRVVAAGTVAEVLTPGHVWDVFGVRCRVAPSALHAGLHLEFVPPA